MCSRVPHLVQSFERMKRLYGMTTFGFDFFFFFNFVIFLKKSALKTIIPNTKNITYNLYFTIYLQNFQKTKVEINYDKIEIC